MDHTYSYGCRSHCITQDPSWQVHLQQLTTLVAGSPDGDTVLKLKDNATYISLEELPIPYLSLFYGQF